MLNPGGTRQAQVPTARAAQSGSQVRGQQANTRATAAQKSAVTRTGTNTYKFNQGGLQNAWDEHMNRLQNDPNYMPEYQGPYRNKNIPAAGEGPQVTGHIDQNTGVYTPGATKAKEFPVRYETKDDGTTVGIMADGTIKDMGSTKGRHDPNTGDTDTTYNPDTNTYTPGTRQDGTPIPTGDASGTIWRPGQGVISGGGGGWTGGWGGGGSGPFQAPTGRRNSEQFRHDERSAEAYKRGDLFMPFRENEGQGAITRLTESTDAMNRVRQGRMNNLMGQTAQLQADRDRTGQKYEAGADAAFQGLGAGASGAYAQGQGMLAGRMNAAGPSYAGAPTIGGQSYGGASQMGGERLGGQAFGGAMQMSGPQIGAQQMSGPSTYNFGGIQRAGPANLGMMGMTNGIGRSAGPGLGGPQSERMQTPGQSSQFWQDTLNSGGVDADTFRARAAAPVRQGYQNIQDDVRNAQAIQGAGPNAGAAAAAIGRNRMADLGAASRDAELQLNQMQNQNRFNAAGQINQAANQEFQQNQAERFGVNDRNNQAAMQNWNANQQDKFGVFDRNQQERMNVFDRNLQSQVQGTQLEQSDRFGTAGHNLQSGYQGANLGLQDRHATAGHNQAERFGAFDRNMDSQFGTFDRNLASQYGAYDRNQADRFGTFDRNQADRFGTFDRNLAGRNSAYDRDQADRFGTFDRNLQSRFGTFDRDLAGIQRVDNLAGQSAQMYGDQARTTENSRMQGLSHMGQNAQLSNQKYAQNQQFLNDLDKQYTNAEQGLANFRNTASNTMYGPLADRNNNFGQQILGNILDKGLGFGLGKLGG